MAVEDWYKADFWEIDPNYKGNLKLLRDLLAENEVPVGVISGDWDTLNGILVATNKRAIFIDKGLMSKKVVELPYERMASVVHETGMMKGRVTIHSAGSVAEFKSVPKYQVRPFADLLRDLIANSQSVAPSAPAQEVNATESPESASIEAPSAPAQEDRITQLERIANLRTQGILTDEKFETEKKKILGS